MDCIECLAKLGDDDGHDTSEETGADCWCAPVVEHYEGGDLIIHHSREEAH